MKTYVIILPTENYERKDLECSENKVYDTYDELIKSIQPTRHEKQLRAFIVLELTDFMEMWNNECDDSTQLTELIQKYWFGYAQVKEDKDKDKVVDSPDYDTSVSKLIALLSKFPPSMGITNEQNEEFIHIINDNDRVILSTHKPIGTCNRTGTYVYPTVVDGYSAFCPELDEDLFESEWTPIIIDLFNHLDKVDEPLRGYITWYIVNRDLINKDNASKLLAVCKSHGYTFDIISDKNNLILKNLRKR